MVATNKIYNLALKRSSTSKYINYVQEQTHTHTRKINNIYRNTKYKVLIMVQFTISGIQLKITVHAKKKKK